MVGMRKIRASLARSSIFSARSQHDEALASCSRVSGQSSARLRQAARAYGCGEAKKVTLTRITERDARGHWSLRSPHVLQRPRPLLRGRFFAATPALAASILIWPASTLRHRATLHWWRFHRPAGFAKKIDGLY